MTRTHSLTLTGQFPLARPSSDYINSPLSSTITRTLKMLIMIFFDMLVIYLQVCLASQPGNNTVFLQCNLAPLVICLSRFIFLNFTKVMKDVGTDPEPEAMRLLL